MLKKFLLTEENYFLMQTTLCFQFNYIYMHHSIMLQHENCVTEIWILKHNVDKVSIQQND